MVIGYWEWSREEAREEGKERRRQRRWEIMGSAIERGKETREVSAK